VLRHPFSFTVIASDCKERGDPAAERLRGRRVICAADAAQLDCFVAFAPRNDEIEERGNPSLFAPFIGSFKRPRTALVMSAE
jgi:hypothetical protein